MSGNTYCTTPQGYKESEFLRLEAALLPSPAHILLSHLRAGKVSSAEKRSLPTSWGPAPSTPSWAWAFLTTSKRQPTWSPLSVTTVLDLWVVLRVLWGWTWGGVWDSLKWLSQVQTSCSFINSSCLEPKQTHTYNNLVLKCMGFTCTHLFPFLPDLFSPLVERPGINGEEMLNLGYTFKVLYPYAVRKEKYETSSALQKELPFKKSLGLCPSPVPPRPTVSS